MFSVYDKVVYPGHGVAQIQRIVEKNISGATIAFYELTFLHKDVTVLVPTNNAIMVGISVICLGGAGYYLFYHSLSHKKTA